VFFTHECVTVRRDRVDNRAMTRWLIAVLLVVASVRADWKDLKEGMEQRAVVEAVGAPLMATRVRRGLLETWLYDGGGCVYFVKGRVQYWQMPKVVPAPVPAVMAARG
jgi:hypothetical protein